MSRGRLSRVAIAQHWGKAQFALVAMKSTLSHWLRQLAKRQSFLKLQSPHQGFSTAMALTLNTLVLLTSTGIQAQFVPPGIRNADLEEQLNAPLNHDLEGPDRNQADSLLRLGGQAQQQGNYQGAIANWLQALNIYQRIGDLAGEGATYDYLGVAYAKLGRYQEAEDALRRRVGIARTRQDFQGQIYGLNNLGTVLLQAGYPDGAEKTFTEALSIARSVKSQAGEGLSLSNLGLATAAQGNYSEAIKHYESALLLRLLSDNPSGEANTRNNLGDAYRAANLYKQALIAYQGGLRVARNGSDIHNQFRALRGLAQSYGGIREYAAALKILEQHRMLAQKEANRPEQLFSLRFAADLYRVTGNLPQAQAFYQDAIALARALGDSQEEAFLRTELAQVIYYRESQ